MHFFDREYRGCPLWEIGRPQPEFVRLEAEQEIVGRVLDMGCGSGENALWFSAHGHDTWGIDFAPSAIRRAREKARERGLSTVFRVGNALQLDALGQTFDTVIDCGLFHTLLDPHRPVYAEGLRSVLRPRGRLFLLCFSENEPTDWGGPRRVSQDELRATFGQGWELRWIHPARFEVRSPAVQGQAWLAAFRPA
jgi:SAM-dependent methyltransferase